MWKKVNCSFNTSEKCKLHLPVYQLPSYLFQDSFNNAVNFVFLCVRINNVLLKFSMLLLTFAGHKNYVVLIAQLFKGMCY